MLTGHGSKWMRSDVSGGAGEGTVSRRALWWPPTKIAGRYLSPYLAALDATQAVDEASRPDGEPVELDLERELPAAADALRQASLRGEPRSLRPEPRRGAQPNPDASDRTLMGRPGWFRLALAGR